MPVPSPWTARKYSEVRRCRLPTNPASGADTETENLRTLANQQYLIPWLWDKDGNELSAADQKLHHRNDGAAADLGAARRLGEPQNVKMYESYRQRPRE